MMFLQCMNADGASAAPGFVQFEACMHISSSSDLRSSVIVTARSTAGSTVQQQLLLLLLINVHGTGYVAVCGNIAETAVLWCLIVQYPGVKATNPHSHA